MPEALRTDSWPRAIAAHPWAQVEHWPQGPLPEQAGPPAVPWALRSLRLQLEALALANLPLGGLSLGGLPPLAV